jgi:hypothetical protein
MIAYLVIKLRAYSPFSSLAGSFYDFIRKDFTHATGSEK